jgi:hypothetical protein
MSLNTTIFLIAMLDLGIVLAVAAIMRVPFRLDRREDEATIHSIVAPLSEDLAA